MSSPGEVRAGALEVLLEVGRGTPADTALGAWLDAHELSPPDRRLVTELVYGTLRYALRLDHSIRAFVAPKGRRLSPRTLWALRLGLYQLWHLDVPDFAAVFETVEALKRHGGEDVALVNAVLRRAGREGEAPLPPEGPARLAVETALPRWLVARWWANEGRERAEARARGFFRRPRLTLRANEARISRDDLLERLRASGLPAVPTSLSPLGVALPHGRVMDLPGFAEGLFQVQGEGAQLAVLAVAAPPGARVADVCAGLGTKSLALLARPQGYDVLSADIDPKRLAAIPAEARRLGLRLPRRVAFDATRPPEALFGAFDAVLVDAPCTSLGLLARHPEIRQRRRPEDVVAMSRREEAILRGAAALVRPGGQLVYSVCTLEAEETRGVVARFLGAEARRFRADEAFGEGGMLTVEPDVATVDEGFFVARLLRLAP